MALHIEDLPARVEAACLGALAGEKAAGSPAGADDFLIVANSAAKRGGLDLEDLRNRGLTLPPACGPPGLLLRAVPFALLSPLDRPQIRFNAYRCVSLAAPNEATAVTALASAVLAADLMRFDLDTALIRLRQTFLEEAPNEVLRSLVPFAVDERLPADPDPIVSLQLAITALQRERGVPSVIGLLAGVEGSRAAVTLGGVLAGARDGLPDGGEWRANVPHNVRASAIARELAERAAALLAA